MMNSLTEMYDDYLTDESIAYMKANYRLKTVNEIADETGLPNYVIVYYLYINNLIDHTEGDLTKDDKKFILRAYGHYTISKLRIAIKHHHTTQITKFNKSIGLDKGNENAKRLIKFNKDRMIKTLNINP